VRRKKGDAVAGKLLTGMILGRGLGLSFLGKKGRES